MFYSQKKNYCIISKLSQTKQMIINETFTLLFYINLVSPRVLLLALLPLREEGLFKYFFVCCNQTNKSKKLSSTKYNWNIKIAKKMINVVFEMPPLQDSKAIYNCRWLNIELSHKLKFEYAGLFIWNIVINLPTI